MLLNQLKMDLVDDKQKKMNRPGCDDYRETKKMIRPAARDEEMKMNSDVHRHPEEEEQNINRHPENKIRPLDDDDGHDHEEATAPSKIQTSRVKFKLPQSGKRDGQEQCACTTCGKVFCSRKARGAHSKVHLREEKERENLEVKVFSSDKARGSHWKMHPREKKEKENLNKIQNKELVKTRKLQNSIYNGGGGGGCRFINAGDPVCSICNRKFKSWESVFGHMRAHPDRGWKGTRPPVVLKSGTAAASESPTATSNANATTNPSHAVGYVDLCRDLIGWTQTGYRGRPSTNSFASSLMNLAYSRPTKRVINRTSSGARIEESASKRRKTAISDFSEYSKSRDLKIREGDGSRIGEFKCSLCSKSLPSYQALGGHRSLHRKEKSGDNINDNTNDSKENEEARNNCHNSFSTGNAPGGHKRLHDRRGQAHRAGEENQAVSNSVANEHGRKMLEFDLNELPPMGDTERDEER